MEALTVTLDAPLSVFTDTAKLSGAASDTVIVGSRVSGMVVCF